MSSAASPAHFARTAALLRPSQGAEGTITSPRDTAGRLQGAEGTIASCRESADRVQRYRQARHYWAAPDAPLPSEPHAQAVARLRESLGGLTCICIMGGIASRDADLELHELVRLIAEGLSSSVWEKAWFVTSGMAGVQRTFAKHCGDGSRLWNLLPHGTSSGYGTGKDVHVGASRGERKAVFSQLGNVYIIIQGGLWAPRDIQTIVARGALIVPVMRRGGASSGMLRFPPEVLVRPSFVDKQEWILLTTTDAPLSERAHAVARIVTGFVSLRQADADLPALGKEPAEAPLALAGSPASAPRHREHTADAIERVRNALGSATVVCILGATVFQCDASEELVKAIAAELSSNLWPPVAFVTSGMPGVQRVFAEHCGDGSRLWNVIPVGQVSGYGVGTDIQAGFGLQQHKDIFSKLGDVYITIAGGPAILHEVRAATNRGAAIIPVTRTGLASSGRFVFPPQALERWDCVTEEHWDLLKRNDVPISACANAVASMVQGAASRQTCTSQSSSLFPNHVDRWPLDLPQVVQASTSMQPSKASSAPCHNVDGSSTAVRHGQLQPPCQPSGERSLHSEPASPEDAVTLPPLAARGIGSESAQLVSAAVTSFAPKVQPQATQQVYAEAVAPGSPHVHAPAEADRCDSQRLRAHFLARLEALQLRVDSVQAGLHQEGSTDVCLRPKLGEHVHEPGCGSWRGTAAADEPCSQPLTLASSVPFRRRAAASTMLAVLLGILLLPGGEMPSRPSYSSRQSRSGTRSEIVEDAQKRIRQAEMEADTALAAAAARVQADEARVEADLAQADTYALNGDVRTSSKLRSTAEKLQLQIEADFQKARLQIEKHLQVMEVQIHRLERSLLKALKDSNLTKPPNEAVQVVEPTPQTHVWNSSHIDTVQISSGSHAKQGAVIGPGSLFGNQLSKGYMTDGSTVRQSVAELDPNLEYSVRDYAVEQTGSTNIRSAVQKHKQTGRLADWHLWELPHQSDERVHLSAQSSSGLDAWSSWPHALLRGNVMSLLGLVSLGVGLVTVVGVAVASALRVRMPSADPAAFFSAREPLLSCRMSYDADTSFPAA